MKSTAYTGLFHRPAHFCTAWVFAVLVCLCADLSWAGGTGAGEEVPNTVTLSYTLGGADLTASSLNTFFVQELLEVSVISADASSVGVVAGQIEALQSYTLTNLGNGTEAFRLIGQTALGGDDFDPVLNTLYLESNGIAGFQSGPGGDEEYIAGTNDPVLVPDESLLIYVTADIPPGVSVDETALLELRAVATTIVTGAGTDDPTQVSFPTVGDVFSGLGDNRSNGSGAVDAMVGLSYNLANPLFADRHDYLVNNVGVTITKTAFDIADPSGGSSVVPGSVVSYRVLVELFGTGSAQSLVVTDPVPGELLYASNSLSVVGLPAGEEADDDLLPAGVDNTGVTGDTIEVNFGDVSGPTSLTIEYQAIVQ